jgi:hypothetical protein
VVLFLFQTVVSAGEMLFESPWGHKKSHLENGGSFFFQTGVYAGEMIFESPWGHKRNHSCSGSFSFPNWGLCRGDAIRIPMGAQRVILKRWLFLFPNCRLRRGDVIRIPMGAPLKRQIFGFVFFVFIPQSDPHSSSRLNRKTALSPILRGIKETK